MAGALPQLRAGLADLNQRSGTAYPGTAGFAGLGFDQQTELLRQVESSSFSPRCI